MFKLQVSKTIDLGFAMQVLIYKKRYAKLDEEIKLDYPVSVSEAIEYMEENLSVSKFNSIKELVDKYFLHVFLIRLAREKPDFDEEQVIDYLNDMDGERFFKQYLEYVIEVKADDEETIKEKIKRTNATATFKEAPSFTAVTYLRRHPLEIKEELTDLIKSFIPVYQTAAKMIEPQGQDAIKFYREKFKSIEDILEEFPLVDLDVFKKVTSFTMYVTNFFELGMYFYIHDEPCHLVLGSGLVYTMSEEFKTKQQAMLFKCFSDPTKLQIIKYIHNDELCAADIRERLKLSKSTVSHHINQLISANIISLSQKDGKKIYYKVNREYVEEMFGKVLNEYT